MRRKEASAHHCNTKARARSVPVARMVSYSEGVWGSAATCAVMLGDSERACVDLWQGAPCWVGCFAGEPQVYTTRLWCWEGLGAGGEGDDRGWDGWMASPTRWTWVWVNSGSWWWTERPGVLRFMGSQRVGHDWATELDWTEVPSLSILTHKFPSCPHPDTWSVMQVWSPGTSLLSPPPTFLQSRAGRDSVILHLKPSPWNRCRLTKHYTLFSPSPLDC